MTAPSPGNDGRLISAAEVARLAGVTRAAVSNWRRRHPDFPEPVGGGRNALFALSEITGWLDRQRKNTEVSGEVLVWQELRARWGDDMTGAVAEIATLLSGGPESEGLSGGGPGSRGAGGGPEGEGLPGGPQARGLLSGAPEKESPLSGSREDQRLDEPTRARLRAMAAETSAEAVVDAFTDRLIASGAALTTTHLARAVAHFAGTVTGTVFDPASGAGTLLLACASPPAAGAGRAAESIGAAGIPRVSGPPGTAEISRTAGTSRTAGASGSTRTAGSIRAAGAAGAAEVKLAGQDGNPAAAVLAAARARLAGVQLEMRIGDSFQGDAWPSLRADLVVCDPPVGLTDWGRDGLLLDRRWEFGIPTKAESELAWLQHCYAHTAPGGRVVFVMPPSVAYRRAGKRIRAELLRAGIVEHIVALPPGMVASHVQPVHLWVLRRPLDGERPPSTVRMTDLSTADPEGPFVPDPAQVAEVPVIDLLDETVDLTPAAHTRAGRADLAGEYAETRQRIQEMAGRIAELLPELPAGTGAIDGGMLRMADLARAGLVDIGERTATSASDQLDTDYLRGFLRSSANSSRSTSSSGTHRADVRGARIPQMDIEEQRRYGAAFRALDEAEEALRKLAEIGAGTIALARDGLTSGTLRP